MPKLFSPVQFESSLDDLNRVRPLIVGDEVKTSLDNSIGNVSPVSEGKPVRGKLLRCDSFGACLRKTNAARFDNYTYDWSLWTTGTWTGRVTFTRKIRSLIARPNLVGTTLFYWIPENAMTEIQNLTGLTYNWLDFKGSVIHFFDGYGAGNIGNWSIIGFY